MMNFAGKRLLIKIKDQVLYQTGIWRRRIIKPRLPSNPDGKVYVNLGSGPYSGKEFINVDITPFPLIHHISDVKELKMFANDSVDFLYSCHVLEHIPRSQLASVLKEWRRVLKMGGTLRISVPDFERLLEVYRASANDADAIVNQLMGQEPPYDAHYSIWNLTYARKLFSSLGFHNIREWNPDNAPHHDFQDKSSRKMRAGDREILISLNIEADK
ncbi:MAG: methyltransferase domain-containing protein [Candidatus Yanofskybacteria bacterium]|nr:methyltransferase domain-containing protein [Candidatus Yanofskybacteria bacterium]